MSEEMKTLLIVCVSILLGVGMVAHCNISNQQIKHQQHNK